MGSLWLRHKLPMQAQKEVRPASGPMRANMNSPGTGSMERIRNDSGLQTALRSLRTNITTSNLVGLIGGSFALFLLLALHEPWNIRVPLYLVILVWTILRPRVVLYLLPFAVPWGSLDIIGVGGLNVNSADILVVLLAGGWLMSFALRPSNTYAAGPRDHEALNVPRYLIFAMLALISTMLLSMTVALSISSSLKEISKWLEFLVLVLLGAQYIRTRRQLWTIIVLICLAGITQAAFGYLQAFFNLGPTAYVRDASLRVYSTFGQPNPYAGYINIPLSIALALMLLGRNWLTRILAGLTALLLAGAEYLTLSRGGEIAIVGALMFIVIVGMPQIRVFVRLLVIGGLGIVEAFLIGLIPIYVLTPIFKALGLIGISFTSPGSQDYSTAERLAHWIAGVHMFLDHPLLGVGIGNYANAYPQYFITIFVDPLGHAHNYYINIAAETGSIGLTAYLLFLLAIFVAGGSSYQYINKKYKQARAQVQKLTPQSTISAPVDTRHKLFLLLHPFRLVQQYRQQETLEIAGMLTNDRALAIGLLAALISVCVHNLVDDLYVHSLTNLIALLLIALIRLEGVTPNVVVYGG